MATNRRSDSKVALAQQRAELRRGGRVRAHIGDDNGSAAAHAAELAKVRRMQDLQEARQQAEKLPESMSAILADLVVDTSRLVRTLVTLPFRVVAALRGHAPAAAGA
jgi:hypothetical protein